MQDLRWLITSDEGLLVRIAAGVLIFAVLAMVDLHRNGRQAQRWREYAFLAVVTLAAMVYGVVNDLITSAISWEYFYYGKGLQERLGEQTPPVRSSLMLEAGILGMKATWSAGLVCGVAVLMANNPRKDKPRLAYRYILKLLPVALLSAVLTAVCMGMAGYWGAFVSMFPELTDNLLRPPRFMCVWAIHAGGYLGGAIGTAAIVVHIVRRRRAAVHRQD